MCNKRKMTFYRMFNEAEITYILWYLGNKLFKSFQYTKKLVTSHCPICSDLEERKVQVTVLQCLFRGGSGTGSQALLWVRQPAGQTQQRGGPEKSLKLYFKLYVYALYILPCFRFVLGFVVSVN